MADITHNDPVVTESKLTEFYNDIKPFLGCPAYVTQEGDEMYFSTDEKVVGKWINNKPLYQKVIYLDDNDPTTTWTSKNIPHNISNVDYISGYGFFQEAYDSNKSTFWLNTVSGSEYFRCTFNKTNITIARSSNWVMQGYAWIILQYTKTTDSASTTIEQKPTHYSTDEQVVGTWIDGKPLYQKTIYMEASYLDANADGVKQTNKKAHNINNIKNIISCDAKLMFNISGDKSGSSNLPFLADVKIIDNVPAPLNVLAWADKTNICIDTSISNMTTWNDSVYFTIQYTKTTD